MMIWVLWSRALLCLLKFHSAAAAVKSVACFAATFHPCKNDRIAQQHHNTGEFFLANCLTMAKLQSSEFFFLRWRQAQAAVASHSHPNTTYHLLLHLIFNLTLISYKVSQTRRQSDFLLEAVDCTVLALHWAPPVYLGQKWQKIFFDTTCMHTQTHVPKRCFLSWIVGLCY